MRRSRRTLATAVAILALPVVAEAQQPAPMMHATRSADLEWAPIQPPGFDAGLEIATVHGDFTVADQPYTIRLRLPDGYRFPAHYHPNAENVTVLSGTFLLTMGEKADDDLTAYEPGAYLFIPATNPHYGGARGATVIQLHGMGPFEILLADPAAGGARK